MMSAEDSGLDNRIYEKFLEWKTCFSQGNEGVETPEQAQHWEMAFFAGVLIGSRFDATVTRRAVEKHAVRVAQWLTERRRRYGR